MPIENIWINEPDKEGVLPPCQFYVSFDVPECGTDAKWGVLVENSVTRVTVDLCDKHKSEFDENRRKIAEKNRLLARKRIRTRHR